MSHIMYLDSPDHFTDSRERAGSVLGPPRPITPVRQSFWSAPERQRDLRNLHVQADAQWKGVGVEWSEVGQVLADDPRDWIPNKLRLC